MSERGSLYAVIGLLEIAAKLPLNYFRNTLDNIVLGLNAPEKIGIAVSRKRLIKKNPVKDKNDRVRETKRKPPQNDLRPGRLCLSQIIMRCREKGIVSHNW